MIPFDFAMQKRILKLHFKHIGFRPTTMRFMLGFMPRLIVINLMHQFFFLLDDIFFRSYRTISTGNVIFIVGPPRCGTSSMLDILNHSEEITSMKLWELYFAPSISLKLLFLQLGKLDRLLGSPLLKLHDKLVDRYFSEFRKVHDTSLFHFEEDAILFHHSANSPFNIFLYPFEELKTPFTDFDQSTTHEYKAKYMDYYKRCIQKHLFVYGKDKIYLSKNPSFCSYIHTIKEHFKTAKFVYMVRTPYQVVPSALSLSTFFGAVNKYSDPETIKNNALQILQMQYTYPYEAMDFKDKKNYAIIQFNDLVSDPKTVVERLLGQFGLKYPNELRSKLAQRSKNEKKYVSKHKYSFDKYNISQEEFLDHFKNILVKFGYEEERA